jgi:hypothetical protein
MTPEFRTAFQKHVEADVRYKAYEKMFESRNDLILSKTSDDDGIMISILLSQRLKVMTMHFISYPTKEKITELITDSYNQAKTIAGDVKIEASITEKCGNFSTNLPHLAKQAFIDSKLPGNPEVLDMPDRGIYGKIYGKLK